MPSDPPRRFEALRSMGRALAHRNYRLFFVGQGVSLIGGWMTRVAMGWLVFRLGGVDAALLLGLMGFVGQLPSCLLAPVAGVLVDRWSRHRLLIATQTLFMVQSTLLVIVAFGNPSGRAAIYQLLALSLLEGFVNAFDMPARHAFLVEMVTDKDDQANAIALNSSLINGARLVGPSVAGLLIDAAGEAWCFVFDAVSSIAIIGGLLAMRLPSAVAPSEPVPIGRGLAEGFAYTFGSVPIRTILLLLAIISLMGMPYSVLLPIFAADILGGGPHTYGFLTAAAGIGALAGALYLAARSSVLGLGRVIVLASCLFGLSLIGFGLSGRLWFSLAMMVSVGFGMMVQTAASNTILQTIVEDDKRGRVMSFYGMAILGMMPFGSLLAGAMAGIIGAGYTVTAGGIACILGGAWFALRLPLLRGYIRPIYIERGILPELARGVESAAELTPPRE